MRGVLLDVNETLIDLNGLQPAFSALGLPDAQPLWFARTLRNGFALAAAGDYRTFAEVASATLMSFDPGRLTPSDGDILLAAFAELTPHPDVRLGLEILADAGIPAMTLSVGSASVIQHIFATHGLNDLVTGHLSVDAVRRWKPAPQAYHYGCELLGLPPHEVTMVAAHSWDLHGARQAGLRTAWISRLEQSPPSIFASADLSAPDLATIAPLIVGSSS